MCKVTAAADSGGEVGKGGAVRGVFGVGRGERQALPDGQIQSNDRAKRSVGGTVKGVEERVRPKEIRPYLDA